MRTITAVLCLLAIVFLAPVSHGQDKTKPDQIVIKDAWVQEVPPVSKNSAAYMKIENRSAVKGAIVSAESDVSRVVELHEMAEVDGMMKMRKVPQIALPARGVATLEPGGYHVMFIDLQRKLKAGDEVKITLRFEGGIEKTIVAPVRKYSDMVK